LRELRHTRLLLSRARSWCADHAGLAVMAILLSLATGPARTQSLTAGLSGNIVSLDPHFFIAEEDMAMAGHVFDHLVEFSPDTKPNQGLATHWRSVEPTVWEFELRSNVVWQDGVPFTADDVAFTIGRVPNIPNSPGGYAGFVKAITKVEVMGPLLIRFHTATPYANLPTDLAMVSIVSRHIGEGATTRDYNSGKAAIGTGPYRVVSYSEGDRLELERNDRWWGPRSHWAHVTYRVITSAAPRTAALVSGDVDIIESVSVADLPILRKDSRFTVFSSPTLRTFDLRHNLLPNTPAFITDNAGQPMARNPLQDPGVRQALTLAINREAISERVMDGTCTPTTQWLPQGSYSYIPNLVPVYNPTEAKALLAKAGLPDGFHMVLHVPSDRYPNSTSVAQAIAQMWSRIGIRTGVEALPWSAFAARRANYEFAISLGGLGLASGEARYFLFNFVGTRNPLLGRGSSNVAGYSNPDLDRLIDEAAGAFDDGERERLLISAQRMAIQAAPDITICQIQAFWATRKPLTYDVRTDERTLAMGVHPND
jgi:peptide/nickel transport system substrate-binding protein